MTALKAVDRSSGRRVETPQAASGRPRVRAKPRSATRTSRRAGLLFVAPFIVLFLLVLVAPLVYAGYTSLFDRRIIGGNVFVGLENYRRALNDPTLRAGIAHVAILLVTQVPLMIGLALLFALIIDSRRVWFPRLIRLSIFVPFAVPGVVAALIWGYLYGPSYGPLASTSRHLGFTPPDFLGSDWMLASIGNIITWEFVGYNMIILYAALQTVPNDLIEAAHADGAGAIRVAWSIKTPTIRPAIVLTVVFSIIGTFQTFNEPSLLALAAPTTVGPGYTPNLYAYNLAFTNQQLNYGAAVSFLVGAVTIIASLIFLAGARRSRGAEW